MLADDHELIREGIKRVLGDRADMEIVAEAKDGLELVSLLKDSAPDLVILDLFMPNLGGIETTREIKKISPQTKVLILTMHNSEEYCQYALAAGAHGYCLKEDATEELFSAINKIRQGEVYISPRLSDRPYGL